MQQGSVIKTSRSEGPDVWQFRWSEKDLNGHRLYRKRVFAGGPGKNNGYAPARVEERSVAHLDSHGGRGLYADRAVRWHGDSGLPRRACGYTIDYNGGASSSACGSSSPDEGPKGATSAKVRHQE